MVLIGFVLLVFYLNLEMISCHSGAIRVRTLCQGRHEDLSQARFFHPFDQNGLCRNVCFQSLYISHYKSHFCYKSSVFNVVIEFQTSNCNITT